MPGARHRPIRVVTLVDQLAAGGGERLAIQVTERLDPARFERTLCASRWTPTLAGQPSSHAARSALEASGVRFVGIARQSKLDVWKWRALTSLLRRERTDVLHAHLFGSNAWAAVLGAAARVPVVIAHDHGLGQLKPLRVRRLVGRHVIARGADAVIAVSEEDRRRMIADGIPAERLVTVANGVATPRPGDPGRLRAELGIDAQSPLVGAVGRLHPSKGYDVLIEAASILAEDFPGLRVAIAGEGPERDRLAQMVSERDLHGTITLLGLRSDVPDVLAALDVAVSSSRLEASPLAVMEYMAAAKPVVATRVGGVAELIDDGVEGLVVEPGQPPALAAAVSALLRDRRRGAELGERARERQRREFSLAAMVGRVEDLYERLARA